MRTLCIALEWTTTNFAPCLHEADAEGLPLVDLCVHKYWGAIFVQLLQYSCNIDAPYVHLFNLRKHKY